MMNIIEHDINSYYFHPFQEGDFEEDNRLIKHGDIMGAKGYIGKSKTGEFTVFSSNVKMLSACMHMLPRSHYGLKDQNTR